MKVKICGITNLKDALDAAKLGADYIGFNFYEKSPRYITPEKAKEIIEKLPKKVKTAGVFVNSTSKQERAIADEIGLDYIQLSGDECVMHQRDLKRFNKKTIKAIHVKGKSSVKKVDKVESDFILLDAPHSGEYGGTGNTFDWTLIRNTKRKIILAGGLTPDNVKEAIKRVRPYAVDVASGVESKPGKKDYKKMKLFIQRTR